MTPLTPSIGELFKDFLRPKLLGLSMIVASALGYQKVVVDRTLFNSLFLTNVTGVKWIESHATLSDFSTMIEQFTMVNATSVDHSLNLVSGNNVGDITVLCGKQTPQAQANRGLVYNGKVAIPNPTLQGASYFGEGNQENGAFFKTLGDGAGNYVLSVGTRKLGIDATISINAKLPSGFDITEEHAYMIQRSSSKVRGIGFFIDDVEVYRLNDSAVKYFLNPSMPPLYAVENLGAVYSLTSSEVDVSVEGGTVEGKSYTSVNMDGTDSRGMVKMRKFNVGTGETAILCFRVPPTINGKINTRNYKFLRMSVFGKDETTYKIYASRGGLLPNIKAIAGWITNANHGAESITGGFNASDVPSALQTAFLADTTAVMQLVYSSREEKDIGKNINVPDRTVSFPVTPDDYIIVVAVGDAINLVGAGLEFSWDS